MPLSLLDMLGMLLRRTPIGTMRRAVAFTEKHNLDVHPFQLEALALGGGDVERVLVATLAAREAGYGDKFPVLSAADMAGEDLVAFTARGFMLKQDFDLQQLRQGKLDSAGWEALRAKLEQELATLAQRLQQAQGDKRLTHYRERVIAALQERQATLHSELEYVVSHEPPRK